MSDALFIALIAVIFFVLTGIFSVFCYMKISHIQTGSRDMHLLLNSRLDALLISAVSQGRQVERDEQRRDKVADDRQDARQDIRQDARQDIRQDARQDERAASKPKE